MAASDSSILRSGPQHATGVLRSCKSPSVNTPSAGVIGRSEVLGLETSSISCPSSYPTVTVVSGRSKCSDGHRLHLDVTETEGTPGDSVLEDGVLGKAGAIVQCLPEARDLPKSVSEAGAFSTSIADDRGSLETLISLTGR
jgi:hypothetical protein